MAIMKRKDTLKYAICQGWFIVSGTRFGRIKAIKDVGECVYRRNIPRRLVGKLWDDEVEKIFDVKR